MKTNVCIYCFASLMMCMYKVIYVRDLKQKERGSYKLISVFDVPYAKALGIDDTDYSQIDTLIALLEIDGEVQSKEYQSLGEISTVLDVSN